MSGSPSRPVGDAKRLRVGDYRVRFESDGVTMTVLHVGRRREAYR